MDENSTGTAGAREFEMVPSDVIGTSRSFAGAADELPTTITGTLDAAGAMLTANPGFAASNTLRAVMQGAFTQAVGGLRDETDDGSRLLKTMAEKTQEADAEAGGLVRTRLDAALPVGDDPGVNMRGEVA